MTKRTKLYPRISLGSGAPAVRKWQNTRQLGRELDVPQSVLSRWKRQANGASDGLDDADNTAEKLRRLRRENVQLCMEHSVKKNDGLLREGFVVRYRFYVVYNPRQQGLDVGGTAVIEPFIYRIEEGGTE